MALIKCPECTQQISDRAAACPYCGNPMAAAGSAQPVAVQTAPGGAVTTEATGKSFKLMQVAGGICMLLGVITCSATSGEHPTGTALFFFAGLALYIAGRAGAWWKHG